nr:MAG TPA: hypothetical protein [Caudoviricetes sp.]
MRVILDILLDGKTWIKYTTCHVLCRLQRMQMASLPLSLAKAIPKDER